MLTRKLAFSPGVVFSKSLIRAFTTPSIRSDPVRAPALGDITHDGAERFNARQKEFRDGLEAAKRRKEQADRQSLHVEPPPSQFVPDSPAHAGYDGAPSSSAAVLNTLGLGSLSSVPDTGEARQAETDTSTKRSGRFSSLIYGTEEGRQMDRDMERSFSQVLARGKYVHSIVFHEVKPDKVDEYVELVGNWYPKIANMEENRVNLVGSWRTEVGETDTFGM